MMKKLMPVDLGPLHDSLLKAKGSVLDAALSVLNSVVLEISPGTAVHTLERWERSYGIVPNNSISSAVRIGTVRARMREKANNKTGTLCKDVYVNIAAALGYEVEIIEASAPFRAGISKAGDPVTEIGELWNVTIVVNNATSAPALETLFNEIFPPYLALTFEYEG
ncbi:MAG TPA: putative phage tail protein [Chitinispirillaceae bacterium]|nr:putative phage tail protein [Chitinispirillaceae bacterium]